MRSNYSLPSSIHHTRFSFFFNDTATTEIYTLSLHDALPIYGGEREHHARLHGVEDDVAVGVVDEQRALGRHELDRDRKSTRLNSSHGYISYAVFCLKKKKMHFCARHCLRAFG